MGIKIGDTPLLLHDPQGAVQGFLSQFLAEHEREWFGEQTSVDAADRRHARSHHPGRVPMPRMNWPRRPKPQINTLWMPTGATRWSVGLFLVDKDTAEKITSAAGGKHGQVDLKLSYDRAFGDGSGKNGANGNILTTTMYLYDAYKVADGTTPLYVLCLVDARYYWQYNDTAELLSSISNTTTWTSLFSSLTGAIVPADPNAKTETINAAYKNPDPNEFKRRYTNLAQLLEAAACSTGTRVVYDSITGWQTDSAQQRVWIQTRDTAQQQQLARDASLETAAGGNSGPIFDKYVPLPEKLRAIFENHIGRLPPPDGDVYHKDVAGDSYVSGQSLGPTGTLHTVFSTAAANSLGHDGGDPYSDNKIDLDALATQIAKDYYEWGSTLSFDLSVVGLPPGRLNGYDDYHWIHFGQAGAGYQCHTRMRSLSWTVAAASNWSQVLPVSLWPSPRLRVQLKGDLEPGGNVTCYPYMTNASGTLDVPKDLAFNVTTTETITAYDTTRHRAAIGRDNIGKTAAGDDRDGAYGIVEYNYDTQHWEFVHLQCLATVVSGTVVDAFTESDVTVTLKDVELNSAEGQQLPSLNTDHHLVVRNFLPHAGNANTPVLAILGPGVSIANGYALAMCKRPADVVLATIVTDNVAKANMGSPINGTIPDHMPDNTVFLDNTAGFTLRAGEQVVIAGIPNDTATWKIIGAAPILSSWQTVITGPTLLDTIQIRGPGLEFR